MKFYISLGFLLTSFSLSAQIQYAKDRVYTGNQVSNTVSVIDPSTNKLLGEIVLGKPHPNVLAPLYKGQALVHGLGYSPRHKMLAVVAIGSNSVTLVSTENNEILKTIYLGRAPHEPTFTPDGSQVWVTVRGEAYLSVIDIASRKEIRQVPVSDGPGMVAFTPDGKFAYVCSSFSPFVDVINTSTYQLVKKIEVPSPFSPNIYMSPDGKLVALSLKDIGKAVVIDTRSNTIVKEFFTGPITNHVSFTYLNGRLIMPVTVGGENKVKIYDVQDDYKLIGTVEVGQIPHGLWPSPDGKRVYVGLEYADQVQPIDLETLKALPAIQVGQSPQALLYVADAVSVGSSAQGLKSLQDPGATQIVTMTNLTEATSRGELAIRTIGMADLVEQLFLRLKPNTAYILSLSASNAAPFSSDYELNSFVTDATGRYAGQSTGLLKTRLEGSKVFKKIVLFESSAMNAVMVSAAVVK